MRRILTLAVACAFPLVAWAADKPAETDWAVDGTWLDTCNCELPCPCWKDEKPTLKACQDMFFFHIDKGHYGAAKLDGVDVVEVGVTADNKKMTQSMGDKDMKALNFYVSKTLTAEQEAGVKAIFSRIALAPPEASKKFKMKKVDLKAQVSDAGVKIEIPKVLDAQVDHVKENGKDKVYPTDTTVAGWIDQGTVGKQVKYNFSDDGQSWKLKGRNATFAHFAWSSKKGPLPGEPGYQAPPAPAKK